jgi:hypothetical protein
MAKETIAELWETIEWLNTKHECSLKTRILSEAEKLDPEFITKLKSVGKLSATKELRRHYPQYDLVQALNIIKEIYKDK